MLSGIELRDGNGASDVLLIVKLKSDDLREKACALIALKSDDLREKADEISDTRREAPICVRAIVLLLLGEEKADDVEGEMIELEYVLLEVVVSETGLQSLGRG